MYNKQFYVYIITNKNNTTFYIGVSDNLMRRISEHKNGLLEGFSKKYQLHKLVYFEEFGYIFNAIRREKQLKNWHRDWKINLIKRENPNFRDLSEEWFNEMPKQVRHDKKEK
ncbi:MAG: GIY-YIG nuclease family protein [Patescibacteria group bacterium]